MTPLGAEQSDVRWKQRFENLQRALRQLEAAVEAHEAIPTNELMVIALIKAYEFSFELSWKTLKDLLAWNGIDAKLPREVIKQAFATGLVEHGQLWIDMLESRPLFTADGDLEGDDGSPEACAVLAAAARMVTESYAPELQALQRNLAARRLEEQGLSEATA